VPAVSVYEVFTVLLHEAGEEAVIQAAAAHEHGVTVWTLDEDFSGLPDVRYFTKKERLWWKRR